MKKIAVLLVLIVVMGCRIDTVNMDLKGVVTVERTIPKYEEAGQQYGREFSKQRSQFKPGNIDNPLSQKFIVDLCERKNLGYFNVHSELKDAFKRGFRVGYEDRTADLILGPHITAAAGKVGENTSNYMADSIATFDQQWESILKDGIEVFIVLISEGSQADRKQFIGSFSEIYSKKFTEMGNKYNKKSRQRGSFTQGGTEYLLDPDLNAIQMPSPGLIEHRFYSQAFVVMGDEWGRRYGTNLVKRDELVDMLRRCKPALEEGEGYAVNLTYICRSFAESYNADSYDTLRSIMKDAGIRDKDAEVALGKVKK